MATQECGFTLPNLQVFERQVLDLESSVRSKTHTGEAPTHRKHG